MARRSFIGRDITGQEYIIPEERLPEWRAWQALPADDEQAEQVPPYAVMITGGTITFENPLIR